MMRSLSFALLPIGVAALSTVAQTPLTPVEPEVTCASLRGFDPRIPEAPTRITDAPEAAVGGKSM